MGPALRFRRRILVATFAATALVVWVLFHPEYKVDQGSIAAPVKAELAKIGFKSVSGIGDATFKTTRSVDGDDETLALHQAIAAVDGLLTEKRSRRRAKFYFEESVGLYVGPLAIVRHTRSVLPIIASLLPGQFWASSRISAFSLQSVDADFPRRAGSVLLATITYEDRYAEGELALTARVQLRCLVRDVFAAKSINAYLPGLASRINCEEQPEPNGRVTAAKGNDAFVLEHVRYSHLYINDFGWSIPAEGERIVRVQGLTAKETWKTELKSFVASSGALGAAR